MMEQYAIVCKGLEKFGVRYLSPDKKESWAAIPVDYLSDPAELWLMVGALAKKLFRTVGK